VRVSDTNNLTIRQDEFESDDMIAGDTVGERVRAAGVFCHVAADGAGSAAGGIGGEKKSVRIGSARKIKIDDAGLNYCAAIFRIDLENAIHAREDEHDAAAAGERAAGKSGAGATTDDGCVIFCGDFDYIRDVLGSCRENNSGGESFFNRAIILIEH